MKPSKKNWKPNAHERGVYAEMARKREATKDVYTVHWAHGGIGTMVYLNSLCLPGVRTAEVMHDVVDGHIRLKLDIVIAPGSTVLEMATDARLYTSDPSALKEIARTDIYAASIAEMKKAQETECNSTLKNSRSSSRTKLYRS